MLRDDVARYPRARADPGGLRRRSTRYDAWSRSTSTAFERIDDPYLQERALDVKDIGQRLLRILLGIDRRTAARTRATAAC